MSSVSNSPSRSRESRWIRGRSREGKVVQDDLTSRDDRSVRTGVTWTGRPRETERQKRGRPRAPGRYGAREGRGTIAIGWRDRRRARLDAERETARRARGREMRLRGCEF